MKKKSKSQNWSGGKLKEISEEISRIFNGQPVVDAKNDLRVVILTDDIKNGKPKHFDECVFAQACKRLFASQKVLLMRSIAYISLPDENGNYKVERYAISSAGRNLISDFDKGKMPQPGTSFVFKAPTKSNTLNFMRETQAKHYKKQRDAKLIGEIRSEIKGEEHKTKPLKQKKIKKPLQSVLDVRNGTGLIAMKKHADKLSILKSNL